MAAAGLTLAALGGLSGLAGLVVGILGTALGELVHGFAWAAWVVAAILFSWGTAQIVTGIKLWSGVPGARPVGIVLAAVGGLISFANLVDDGLSTGMPIIALTVCAAHAFVLWALLTRAG
jgi:hypothetical protein